jgi:hypothetical protein
VASVVARLLSSGNYFNELKSFKEQSMIEERGLKRIGVLSWRDGTRVLFLSLSTPGKGREVLESVPFLNLLNSKILFGLEKVENK